MWRFCCFRILNIFLLFAIFFVSSFLPFLFSCYFCFRLLSINFFLKVVILLLYSLTYCFVHRVFSKALKFYMHDVTVQPDRADTWAAMALARKSRLENKLNAVIFRLYSII